MNNEPDYDNLYFEEKKMQKTPEVGDVWQSTRKNAQKIYLTHVMGRVYCITEQGVASTKKRKHL